MHDSSHLPARTTPLGLALLMLMVGILFVDAANYFNFREYPSRGGILRDVLHACRFPALI
jgi:hypothetical protein